MIHIVYGTRAELIKLSPLISRLKKDKVEFKTIDTGQHDTSDLRKSLKLPKTNYHFGKSSRNKWSKLEANFLTQPFAVGLSLLWGAKVFTKLYRIFSKEGDVVVIHGNPMGVPVTVFSAKLNPKKIKLVHVESGLRGRTRRSFLLDWFYRIADHNSHILFVPFKTSENNLVREKVKGKIIYTGNIVKDVVQNTLKIKTRVKIPKNDYVLANFSRSILTKRDAKKIINSLTNSNKNILVVINPKIQKRLERFHLLDKLKTSEKIILLKNMKYPDFLHLLNNSIGVITDSNGVQEESYFLGKPCAITNDFVQHSELVWGTKIRVVGTNEEKLTNFLNSLDKTKINYNIDMEIDPTEKMSEVLKGLVSK